MYPPKKPLYFKSSIQILMGDYLKKPFQAYFHNRNRYIYYLSGYDKMAYLSSNTEIEEQEAALAA